MRLTDDPVTPATVFRRIMRMCQLLIGTSTTCGATRVEREYKKGWHVGMKMLREVKVLS